MTSAVFELNCKRPPELLKLTNKHLVDLVGFYFDIQSERLTSKRFHVK